MLDRSGTKVWVQVSWAGVARCPSLPAGGCPHRSWPRQCFWPVASASALCKFVCGEHGRGGQARSETSPVSACSRRLQFVQHVTGYQHYLSPPLFGFSLPMSALLYLRDGPGGTKLICKQVGAPGRRDAGCPRCLSRCALSCQRLPTCCRHPPHSPPAAMCAWCAWCSTAVAPLQAPAATGCQRVVLTARVAKNTFCANSPVVWTSSVCTTAAQVDYHSFEGILYTVPLLGGLLQNGLRRAVSAWMIGGAQLGAQLFPPVDARLRKLLPGYQNCKAAAAALWWRQAPPVRWRHVPAPYDPAL